MGSPEKKVFFDRQRIKKLKNVSRENSYPNSHGRDWWIGGR